MNLVSKNMLIKIVLAIFIGACLSMLSSLFLPNKNFFNKNYTEESVQSSFEVKKAFGLETKEAKASSKVANQQSVRELLLKEFVINGIFLDEDDSMVIIKDAKGGIFLHLNEVHKNYKLVSVFLKKAKFQKGSDFYWSFLDPLDEKEFVESPKFSASNANGSVNPIRKTVAVEMFEDIKFKDGKYYIPKDMLSNKTDMMRHLKSASARIFNTRDGVISFKISYLPRSSVFYKLGIRQGDFIVKANGEAFKTINDPIKFFQNIGNVKQLSITVKRGNKNKELKYEVY
jgi:type II secretory pathway component PulC